MVRIGLSPLLSWAIWQACEVVYWPGVSPDMNKRLGIGKLSRLPECDEVGKRDREVVHTLLTVLKVEAFRSYGALGRTDRRTPQHGSSDLKSNVDGLRVHESVRGVGDWTS